MGRLLAGKTCLVTGSSRGIGHAIVELFAAEGAFVYAASRQETIISDGMRKQISKSGGGITSVIVDVTNIADIRALFLRIKQEHGDLDVVVNNAGVVTNEPLGMITREIVHDMFEVNVYAALEILQYSARIMARQHGGSIINISSITAMRGQSGQVAYSASKGAVIAMTKSAALELAPKHVRVNSVAPAMTNTERIQKTIREKYKGSIPEIGIGRLVEPSEVADACLYFASDLSINVTGEVLLVGGSQK